MPEANGATDITRDESAAIAGVDLDTMTTIDEGSEMAKKPRKKKLPEKAVTTISPAQQAVSGDVSIEPDMTDPEWSSYVIRQLDDDEKDVDGNPYVHGLRRIVSKLLGPILKGKAHVIQAPRFIADLGLAMQPATVEYTLEILMGKTLDGIDPYVVELTDVADVYAGNTDPEYARHPSAMAATRAEGRCLRKALQLKRVVAAEEMTLVPIEASGANGCITPTQINFIDKLCKQLKVDVMKYVNMGERKFDTIDDVPHKTALKMTEHLTVWTNNPSKVPESIKGYKIDWMNSQC